MMSGSLVDSFLEFFGYTESKRKRDQYDKLHDYLKSKEKELEKLIEEIESAKKRYDAKNGGLSSDKIPAREFEVKRPQKDQEYSKTISYFREALGNVRSAKSRAYQKWEKYKAQAISEEQTAAAAIEAEKNKLKNS
ncbi:hypothetical protein CN887_18295 [Bacillus pseudomycoides]|nr:hypothetical protein CN887_18295 [Bacillus pseudomycoides]